MSDIVVNVRSTLAAVAAERPAFPFDAPGGPGIAVADRTAALPTAMLVGFSEDGVLQTYVVPVEGLDFGRAALSERFAAHLAAKRGAIPPSRAAAELGLVPDLPGTDAASVGSGVQARHPTVDGISGPAAQAYQAIIDGIGVSDIRSRLDVEALRVLSVVGKWTWSDYRFYAAPGVMGQKRRQAAAAYPLLATLFSGNVSLKMTIDRGEEIAGALARIYGNLPDGRPVFPKSVLKRLNGLSWPAPGIDPKDLAMILSDPGFPADWFPRDEAEWQAFCDIAATTVPILSDGQAGIGIGSLFQAVGGRWQQFRERLAKAAADDRPPQGIVTEEEERALKESVDLKSFEKLPRERIREAVEQAAARAVVPDGVPREDVVDWLLRLYAPPVDRLALGGAASNAVDAAKAFASKVVLPAAYRASGVQDSFLTPVVSSLALSASMGVLFGGRGAPEILKLGRSFDNRRIEIMAAGAPAVDAQPEEPKVPAVREDALRPDLADIPLLIQDDSETGGWPALFYPQVSPDGIWIIPLTGSLLLQDEGVHGKDRFGVEGLHHCVGTNGYDRKCTRDGHHIVSIRKWENGQIRRLATVELGRVALGSAEVEVRQFYGLHNRQAPAEAHRAWEWLMGMVQIGLVPFNHDALRAFVAKTSAPDLVRHDAGYDWRDPDRILQAMRPWGRFVQKRFREMGVKEFGICPELLPTVREISPDAHRRIMRDAAKQITGPGPKP
jgi:hypothetical protein